jgi:hypothetical protein
MKETHPDWGIDRIHDMLLRTEGSRASSTAIGNLLKEEGYEAVEVNPRRHPDRVRRFERVSAVGDSREPLVTQLPEVRAWTLAPMFGLLPGPRRGSGGWPR